MATLQEQYNQINEGKGAKDVFLKHAKSLFAHLIPNQYGYDETINILKQRGIIVESQLINEHLWGIVTNKPSSPDWFKIFNENINENSQAFKKGDLVWYMDWDDNKNEGIITGFEPKGKNGQDVYDVELENGDKKWGYEDQFIKRSVDESIITEAKDKKSKETKIKANAIKVSKEVEDIEEKAYDNKTKTTVDNVIFDQLLRGVQFEMRVPKNLDKTVDELKNIVLKNLQKDPIWYTKNAMFGVEGIGYTDEAVSLKVSKSDHYEPVSKEKPKSNFKDNGKKENAKGNPKGIKELTNTPKSSKGVKKMDLPGKQKTIKLK